MPERFSAYREELVSAGILRAPGTPRDIAAALGLPVLKLDAAGRKAAARHIEKGSNGAAVMTMPAGMPPWLEAAIASRIQREQSNRQGRAA